MDKQLPDVVARFIHQKYGQTPVKVDTSPYWSSVRFQFSTAGALAVSQRQAFGYAIGGIMDSAGYPANRIATMSDTNLQKPGETRLNADIFVGGVACFPLPASEPELMKRIWAECAVELSTDGQNSYPLATLEMIPAGGGLLGNGNSAIKLPALNVAGIVDNGEGANESFSSNGNPIFGNYLELGAPVLWTGQQGVDSNFRLNFRIDRAIAEPVAPARAAAAGVQAYTPPVAIGDPGTFVDVRVRLATWAISRLSVNG
jgi:hypothetical protein